MKRKTIKLVNKDLKKLVKETLTTIFEADEAPAQQQDQQPNLLNDDSLDAKVDAFLVQAESAQESSMEESIKKFVNQLLEADTPEGAAPQEPKTLNVHVFARESARLIDNLENLLDLRGIILRRCLNFVSKNYDEQTKKQVEDILSQDFSISQKSELEKEDHLDVPNADRAGPNVA